MITIENYHKKYEKKLMDLFYRSNFFLRDEFEYVKEPDWISRYINSDSIVKLALDGNRIVATLGATPIFIESDKKAFRGLFFVDNCILPEYDGNYEEIFTKLFNSVESEAKKINVDFILGWDYVSKYQRYGRIYDKLGYRHKKGINWVIYGMQYDKNHPKIWKGKNKIFWRILLHGLKHYHHYLWNKNKLSDKRIRVDFQQDNFTEIIKFLKQFKVNSTGVKYSAAELRRLVKKIDLHICTARINGDIVGIIIFNISPWTGLMFGNPIKDFEWEKFYTVTIDEFVVANSHQYDDVPLSLFQQLVNCTQTRWHPEIDISSMITDLVDIEDKWKIDFYRKIGFFEPEVDKGAIFWKPIKNLTLNPKIWTIPTRHVVAPRIKQ